MADAVAQPGTQRYALVTGANKGIGFEICRQLASEGIVVILTSRDEKRGIEAQEKLKEFDNLVFHQLDVVDPASVAAVAEFVKTKFGRLDILVNNAGVLGVGVDGDTLVLQECVESAVASISSGELRAVHLKSSGKLIETLKGAEECIETNYYGVKRVTEALIPLLQLSPSPRIVNVSSLMGSLVLQPNAWAKGVWGSEEGLTEERVDESGGRISEELQTRHTGTQSLASSPFRLQSVQSSSQRIHKGYSHQTQRFLRQRRLPRFYQNRAHLQSWLAKRRPRRRISAQAGSHASWRAHRLLFPPT